MAMWYEQIDLPGVRHSRHIKGTSAIYRNVLPDRRLSAVSPLSGLALS